MAELTVTIELETFPPNSIITRKDARIVKAVVAKSLSALQYRFEPYLGKDVDEKRLSVARLVVTIKNEYHWEKLLFFLKSLTEYHLQLGSKTTGTIQVDDDRFTIADAELIVPYELREG